MDKLIASSVFAHCLLNLLFFSNPSIGQAILEPTGRKFEVLSSPVIGVQTAEEDDRERAEEKPWFLISRYKDQRPRELRKVHSKESKQTKPRSVYWFVQAGGGLEWGDPRREETDEKKMETDEVKDEDGSEMSMESVFLEEEEDECELQARLNDILPPRKWEEQGQYWIQKVSPEPTTRIDVIKLSHRLEEKMVEEDARDIGICDVRRRLYSQLFDELIRQTTINNPPLGLLLLKVRDDLNMTMMCYRDLHDSGMVFGINKAVQAEMGRRELEEIIEQLKKDTARLEDEKNLALKSVVEKERRSYAERDLIEALHAEKMEHYEKTNKAFKELLDTVMISKV